VTILQNGTVDTYPGVRVRVRILVGEDPHGIVSRNELQIFQVGDELFQVGLVTYFSLDLVWYKSLNCLTLNEQINRGGQR